MKLDRDCVRQLLLSTEELPYEYMLTLDDFNENEDLSKFGFESCIYVTEKLIEAGFINGKVTYADNGVYDLRIKSLTWDGHQFLDNIRDDGVWKSAKQVTSKFSSVSLSMLGTIAASIISKMISNEIQP